MKFNEASAVFLIIGGVLLGPISGRSGKIIEPMMENCGPGMVCARHPGETTAETCTRAMREIGAVPWYLLPPGEPMEWVNKLPERLSDGTAVADSAKNYVHFWTLQHAVGPTTNPKSLTRVLCIPSPSGLMR